MRGRSYSPSPPRGYGRRVRSPSPRGRYGGRGGRGDEPTSLLVRNLRLDCRPDDLRRPFGQFGQLKDVYLPRDYYTGEPRGFGFVQYLDPDDAAEAKHHMDGEIFQGRQLTVVFAEENRKKPTEMRFRERSSHRGGGYDRRRPTPRYSHSTRYSRSPPPRYARSHNHDYSPSPRGRDYSRSISPQRKSMRREKSFSHTPPRASRSRSRGPVRGDQSPPHNAISPVREHSPAIAESRSPSHSRSRSVDPL